MTKLPRKEPVLKKMYFGLDTSNGISKEFKRYAYQLLNNKSVTLIHYVGDEKVSIAFPHGNRKHHPEKKYTRTCPSYLNTCKELVKTSSACSIYKKAVENVSCSSENAATSMPRNLKQLRNLRYSHLKQMKISQDSS